MSSIDLKKLKAALPFGAQADAARKFGITDSAVSQIISGKTENYIVLQYLIARAKGYQKFIARIEKEMEAL
jgi:predicted transcriptional regulator